MKDRTEQNSRKKKAMYGRGREMTGEEEEKKRRVRMTERIKKTEKRQQEQEGHRGWTQGTDSQRPEDRGDSWQDFDTKKARSTLTAEQKKTRNDAAARGGGRVRGEERQQRERTRGRAVLMCAREIDTRETVCWECVGIRGTLFFFFFQRTDRTYLKAKL